MLTDRFVPFSLNDLNFNAALRTVGLLSAFAGVLRPCGDIWRWRKILSYWFFLNYKSFCKYICAHIIVHFHPKSATKWVHMMGGHMCVGNSKLLQKRPVKISCHAIEKFTEKSQEDALWFENFVKKESWISNKMKNGMILWIYVKSLKNVKRINKWMDGCEQQSPRRMCTIQKQYKENMVRQKLMI